MLEKQIEAYFRSQCTKQKWLALKLTTPAFTGIPDRLVLLPNGKIYFVELKAPGKVPRPRQLYVHAQLQKYGHTVVIIDTQNGVNEWIRGVLSALTE